METSRGRGDSAVTRGRDGPQPKNSATRALTRERLGAPRLAGSSQFDTRSVSCAERVRAQLLTKLKKSENLNRPQ